MKMDSGRKEGKKIGPGRKGARKGKLVEEKKKKEDLGSNHQCKRKSCTVRGKQGEGGGSGLAPEGKKKRMLRAQLRLTEGRCSEKGGKVLRSRPEQEKSSKKAGSNPAGTRTTEGAQLTEEKEKEEEERRQQSNGQLGT